MHYHYLDELAKRFAGQYRVDLSEIRTKRTADRVCEVSPELFDSLADYTRSLPTGPSSGRVYKKNLGWHSDTPDNWWVFFVRNANDGTKDQLHHPFKLIVDKGLGNASGQD